MTLASIFNRSLLILLPLGIPLVSQAIVADRFLCETRLTNESNSEMFVQRSEFSVARLPLSYSPAPNVRLTVGQLNLSQAFEGANDEYVDFNTNISYTHAVRLDASGTAVQAKEYLCAFINVGNCSPKDPTCSSPKGACNIAGDDPFNTNNPNPIWADTQIVDGTPVLSPTAGVGNFKLIGRSNRDNIFTGTGTCTYLGTYN